MLITEDQTAVIEFLASPTTYGQQVERIDTHTAVVFLAGSRAYKLKRAVRFDYVDFSTSVQRRAFCEAELRLNRRTAPALDRAVVPVTREPDGALALGGQGASLDWVVEMNRFPQDALFDRRAAAGQLDLALMAPLAEAIAAFHKSAERRTDHGGTAGMGWVIDGNAAGFKEFGATCLEQAACQRLTESARCELGRVAELLDSRRQSGYVRECHGDLHLRNIVLLDGRPTLFDGVEFNDEISCTDTYYDLAFLLMDLWRRGLPRHANAVWNAYYDAAADPGGVALLPLFLSCRAGVRAKTSATSARLQRGSGAQPDAEQLARQYLAMAEEMLHPPGPCLVAIGGRSGSGKSTVAAGLAPSVGAVPGAVVLRSDQIRKRLCAVSPLQRLGPQGYASQVSERVYTTCAARAAEILTAGHSVIVDAVFGREADRQAIAQVAALARVPFIALWLEAAVPTLLARVSRRENDPSDADADVVRLQHSQGVSGGAWHRLDASPSVEQVLRDAGAHLQAHLGQRMKPVNGGTARRLAS